MVRTDTDKCASCRGETLKHAHRTSCDRHSKTASAQVLQCLRRRCTGYMRRATQ